MTGSIRGARLLLVLALMVAACGSGSGTLELEPPATKVPIDGTDRYRVLLTEMAAERLDIQTAVVTESDGGLVVPSAAVIVDPTGQFWVYVNPAPLTYERAALASVREDDGMAYFADGPPPGTAVVVVGVPELYGEETGVGK